MILISAALGSKESVDVVYLDFQKVFDGASYELLVLKLTHVCIHLRIVFRIRAFLIIVPSKDTQWQTSYDP